MKKHKALLSIFVLAGVAFLVIYFSNSINIGQLLGLTKYEVGNTYYFGYEVNVKGFLNPVIKDIKLIRKNGTVYNKKDNNINYECYIDTKSHTGITDDFELKNNSNFCNYVPVKDYKVKNKKFQIVLGISFKNDIFDNDIKGMEVTYNLFSLRKYSCLT